MLITENLFETEQINCSVSRRRSYNDELLTQYIFDVDGMMQWSPIWLENNVPENSTNVNKNYGKANIYLRLNTENSFFIHFGMNSTF